MSKTEMRYCRRCEKAMPHDVTPHTPNGEKVFLGVATFGLIPLFESLTRGAPNGPGMYAKVYICQSCKKREIIDAGEHYE